MYSRRTFLKQVGLMSAALSIPSYIHAAPKPSFKLGLQLYTIRDAMEKDLKKTLQRVSGFGYQEVETYGFNYGNNKDYWGLAPKDAKRLLDDCNLTTPTGHYDLDKFFGEGHSDADMKRYVDQCIEGAHALQQSYITWPWLSPENRTPEQFKKLAATLNTIGEQIKQGGLQLAYHNHGFEFDDHNGVTGYDIILQETDAALVKLQLDLYWLSHSSVIKPQDWFKQQPGRFVMWHIKDMDKVDRELHTTVGDGVIDFKSILQHHKIAGLKHIFVEQGNNYVPDDMSCVERSAKYVKTSLLKRV